MTWLIVAFLTVLACVGSWTTCRFLAHAILLRWGDAYREFNVDCPRCWRRLSVDYRSVGSEHTVSKAPKVVASVQTLIARKELPPAVVCLWDRDECHHTVAPGYNEVQAYTRGVQCRCGATVFVRLAWVALVVLSIGCSPTSEEQVEHAKAWAESMNVRFRGAACYRPEPPGGSTYLCDVRDSSGKVFRLRCRRDQCMYESVLEFEK